MFNLNCHFNFLVIIIYCTKVVLMIMKTKTFTVLYNSKCVFYYQQIKPPLKFDLFSGVASMTIYQKY